MILRCRIAVGLSLFFAGVTDCPAQTPDLVSSAPKPADTKAGNKMKRSIKEPWHDVTCTLLRRGEAKPLVVEAKKAVYRVTRGRNSSFSVPLTVFTAPVMGSTWAGVESTYYIEESGGIVGVRLLGSDIFWCDNLSDEVTRRQSGAQQTNDNLVTSTDANITGVMLYTADGRDPDELSKRLTPLEVVIDHGFFMKTPRNSFSGVVKLISAEIDNGELKLGLKNELGKRVSVWIDLKTRKALRGVDEASETGIE